MPLSSHIHPSGPLLITVWGVLYLLCCDCPFQGSVCSLETRLMSYSSFNPQLLKQGSQKADVLNSFSLLPESLEMGWSFSFICNGCYRKHWRMNLSRGIYWFLLWGSYLLLKLGFVMAKMISRWCCSWISLFLSNSGGVIAFISPYVGKSHMSNTGWTFVKGRGTHCFLPTPLIVGAKPSEISLFVTADGSIQDGGLHKSGTLSDKDKNHFLLFCLGCS